MRYLARHLRTHFDVETRVFSYRSVSRDLADNAAALNNFLRNINREVIHLVGHSLGGLVIRALFHFFPEQANGRIVMLATPSNGSKVAARLLAYPPGRQLIGRSIRQYQQQGPSWPVLPRELGVIAGTGGPGMGQLIARLPVPNDGTVALTEVFAGDSRDRLALGHCHTSMLFSAEVAQQVGLFLRNGSFGR